MKLILLLVLLMSQACFAFDDPDEDETTADLHTKIDVHFNFENKEWSDIDKYWVRHIKQSWDGSWAERMTQTQGYHKASVEGKEKLLVKAKAIDDHVRALKESVSVILHSDETMPYMSYCVLPRGYKVSHFSNWEPLPPDSIPGYITFFPDLIEHFLKDYNRESDYSNWLISQRGRDNQHYQDEYQRAEWLALKWAKRQESLIKVGYVSFYSSKVSVTEYLSPQDKNTGYVGLSVVGFEPAPAVAWRCPPSVPENPLKYGLIKKELK